MSDIFYDELLDRSTRVYLLRKLNDNDQYYLRVNGFRKIKKTNLDGKKTTYFVKRYDKESERHMILIFEAVRFLNRLATEVQTFRSVRPDIVFKFNKKFYAIEVETGIIYTRNRGKIKEKVKALNDEFKDRWCFLVTDRNFKKKYQNYGKTLDKRNFKSGILKWLTKCES